MVAYALSAGNAGTGFRYRSHLVTLAIAAMAILREQVLLAREGGRVRPTGAQETRSPSSLPNRPVPLPA